MKRIAPIAALALLFAHAAGAQAQAAAQTPTARPADAPRANVPDLHDADDPLVDAAAVVPGLLVRLAYATSENITHRPLYPADARCLLRRSVAARLAEVARSFEPRGVRLVAWDCTRPAFAQLALFRAYPHPGSVADPKKGSLHERGVAIDLALADRDGVLLPLPTPFDTFGPRARANDELPEGPVRANRDALIAAMYRAGFRVNPKEWWHFSRLYGYRWPPVAQSALWPDPLESEVPAGAKSAPAKAAAGASDSGH